MTTITFAAIAAVTFGGGNVSDLAKSIAEATRQPVVFEAGAAERAPKFTYNPDNLNEMARQIQTSANFRRAPGSEQVFHHGRLPSHFFGINLISRYANTNSWLQGGPVPENFLNEGKVTLQSRSGQSVSLNSLPAGLLSKPLQTHWMFDRSVIKAWVTDQPAEDFMTMVAKAIGGKFLTRQDRFVIDIDPGEIQRRALATLAFVQADRRYPTASYRDKFEIELSRAGISALGAPQISGLLASSSGRFRMEIPASMRPAIGAYVTAMLSGEAEEEAQLTELRSFSQVQIIEDQRGRNRGEERQRRGSANQSRLRNLDPRLIGYADIDARFRVTLQLATRDALGRPGSPVRLP